VTVAAEQFKDALREWASGVTIVTSRHGEQVHGMTVSSFASVSLDPPLVLVCADQDSNTHGVIAEGGVFAVHVLGRDQGALSNLFASKAEEERRFDGLAWEAGVTGAPILADAVAVLDCRVASAHDAGDHVIYVGTVEDVRVRGGEPLLYHRGRYAGVTGG
jgi:flavin reductase (DIM6/NTAB) family NADH-FMN oxidoreductase RutF